MDASDLAALSFLVVADSRHRLRPKPSNHEVQAMVTSALDEVGLGEIKIGRALYTLRRRIAAHQRLERLARQVKG
jgi:hypothetical protein